MQNSKDSQVVMRITQELESKIKAAAQRKGLSMAAWLRMLAIEAIQKEETNA